MGLIGLVVGAENRLGGRGLRDGDSLKGEQLRSGAREGLTDDAGDGNGTVRVRIVVIIVAIIRRSVDIITISGIGGLLLLAAHAAALRLLEFCNRLTLTEALREGGEVSGGRRRRRHREAGERDGNAHRRADPRGEGGVYIIVLRPRVGGDGDEHRCLVRRQLHRGRSGVLFLLVIVSGIVAGGGLGVLVSGVGLGSAQRGGLGGISVGVGARGLACDEAPCVDCFVEKDAAAGRGGRGRGVVLLAGPTVAVVVACCHAPRYGGGGGGEGRVLNGDDHLCARGIVHNRIVGNVETNRNIHL